MLLILLGLAIGTLILYICHMLSCRCLFRIIFFQKLPHPMWCLVPCCWGASCCMTVRQEGGRETGGGGGDGGDGGGGDGGGGDGDGG
jgi:uncharacterized membrane protein YgcG